MTSVDWLEYGQSPEVSFGNVRLKIHYSQKISILQYVFSGNFHEMTSHDPAIRTKMKIRL
jgi:hypothetical protein